MAQTDILLAVVILLAVGVVVLPFFKRLGLGSVLGFLTAGVIVGPWGLKLAEDVDAIRHFAEFGVVFLLFIIGLELAPSKMWAMRGAVFGLGTLQIVVTGFCIAGYAWLFDIPWNVDLVVGFGLALSSTAIGLQMLNERGEIATPHGQTSFAILLMQDMAIVPLLALLPLMGMKTVEAGEPFLVEAGKVIAAVAAVIVAVRYGLQPMLRRLAITRNTEAFVAAVLLTVLGSSWLMEQVHVSMALGAFLTGLLLADSEYRHQIEAEVEPFRAYLLGLFFISIGMSIDFGLLAQKGLVVLGHVLGLLVIKAVVLFGLCKAAGHSFATSVRVALLLPQCGEFGFVLFGAALGAGVMGKELFQALLALIALTMAVSPLLVPLSSWVIRCFEGEVHKKPLGEAAPADIKNHVIIAGFGRVGEMLATLLQKREVPYTALEIDAEKVTRARARGFHVYYGDAQNGEVLHAAGADRATLAVVSLDRPEAAEKAVSAIRYLYPRLPIQARARDLAHSNALYKLGATGTVTEFLEGSLQLGRASLLSVGMAEDDVAELIENFRRNDYALVKEVLAK